MTISLVLGGAALSGCTDLKRGLGMEKVVPDEFAVTASAPLAVPPDFTLRPPRPGQAPTQQQAAVDQARQTVFRASDAKLETLPPATSRSPGESALLKDAGAQTAPSNIRQLVNNEYQAPPDTKFADKLLFWRPSDTTAPADQIIDPEAEAERLHAAAATPAGNTTATATTPAAGAPTIERTKQKGFWDWLF